MTRLTLLATVLVLWSAPAPAAAAPQLASLDGITVTIEPTGVSVVLGENFDIEVTITNQSDQPSAALVAHLDITDPAKATSVDPEDWTSTLSKPVGVIEPGGSTRASWNLQPISAGTFAAYAVAISPDAPDVAASNVLTVSVADQRSLNPGGILPLAIGAPVVVGALLVFQIRATRRTSESATSHLGSDPE